MDGLFPVEHQKRRELREDQFGAMQKLRDSFRTGHKRPILQGPTGFGKTVIGSAIVQGAVDKGRRVIFCVPRIDLIDQTVNSFARDGIHEVGVIQANHPLTDYSKPVQVASVQTLIKRGFPPADLVVIDEVHLAFEKIHDWLKQPDWLKVPFVGLSATPWTKGLGLHWDDLIVAATTQEMIDAGNLSPFKVFAPSHPDLKGVKVRMGDYAENDLSKAMNKAPLVADIVQTWLEHGQRRPTLVFAVDRAHAMHLQQQFMAAGVSAGYQDAHTKPDERAALRRGFHNGLYEVVCNVGTLTTGVDWDVRCIVLARPTKSEILYTQIVGRGLRTAPGKSECLILDHSDTTLRLGFVTDIYHDELDDGKEREKEEKKVILPKECPRCHYLRPPRVSKCPSCGFEAQKQPKPVETATGQLEELTTQADGRTKLQKERNKAKGITLSGTFMPAADFYAQLMALGNDRGYRPGWAANKYREAFGVWPNAHRDVIPRTAGLEVRSWVKAGQIRYNLGQQKKNAREWYGSAAE